MPKDKLLVETDAPFLSPVPMRGKRNEPAYVDYTAKFLAKLLDIEKEYLESKTTKNFIELFNVKI